MTLVAGICWKRANSTGAGLSIVLGFTAWVAMQFIAPEAVLPPQFVGLVASTLGMLIRSLLAAQRQSQMSEKFTP